MMSREKHEAGRDPGEWTADELEAMEAWPSEPDHDRWAVTGYDGTPLIGWLWRRNGFWYPIAKDGLVLIGYDELDDAAESLQEFMNAPLSDSQWEPQRSGLLRQTIIKGDAAEPLTGEQAKAARRLVDGC
jgi:hypothetical protein